MSYITKNSENYHPKITIFLKKMVFSKKLKKICSFIIQKLRKTTTELIFGGSLIFGKNMIFIKKLKKAFRLIIQKFRKITIELIFRGCLIFGKNRWCLVKT